MTVQHLTIRGYRGFSNKQQLNFAQPSGLLGSGLTILVGPNSGGKSTVVESLSALSSNRPTYSEGKRNKSAGDRVSLTLSIDNTSHKLQTVSAGGSETTRTPEDSSIGHYVLPSRRFFNPYFGQGSTNRRNYLRNSYLPPTRSSELGSFSQRLFKALERKERFNEMLGRIVNRVRFSYGHNLGHAAIARSSDELMLSLAAPEWAPISPAHA